MRLEKLSIQNFRTIDGLSFEFPCYYTAISGRNNSGKSNLLRALKILFEAETRYGFFAVRELSFAENFPIWKGKESKEAIKISCDVHIERQRDSSVFKLAVEFFELGEAVTDVVVTVSAEYSKDKDQPEIVLRTPDKTLDSYKSRTMHKTIRSAGAFQFHDSTEPSNPFNMRTGFSELLGEIGKDDRTKIEDHRDKFTKAIGSVAKRHQREITELLGRLEERYVVGLSAPKLNVDSVPVEITLGEKQSGVSLDEWGSGTQNKTYILMAMFRAKKLSESPDEDRKIAPILVIEEPESFLHPSAQAEFGRLLQDVSEELQIQLIVATHNPYFLSQKKPESNILLRREAHKGQTKFTEQVKVGTENWMEPFAANLGLANPEFEPWKELIFGAERSILMVEGPTDQAYLEMLRSDEHGSDKLNFTGTIYPYGGRGNLENGVLLKFIKSSYKQFFITYDLDADGQLSKVMTSLQMEKNKNFCPVGLAGGGKECIEGLLPESVSAAVYGANPALVQRAIAGTNADAKSAKNELKRLQLEEFKRVAVPGKAHFGELYKLAKIINKAMA
jgi:putative ATP-dependent endonuclease of OLD family